MSDSYSIKGGKPLKGKVILSGAKNVALKTIIASLMFETPVVLDNIPRISDVMDLVELIKTLGASAEFDSHNRLTIDGSRLKSDKVDLLYGNKIRVSFMLFAPLLFHFKTCQVPNPGGCRIGARPIDRIINGMRRLGIRVNYESETGYYQATMDAAPEGVYRFEKPSHTGTELLMMLGVMTGREVTIVGAATEPEIDDLISFLKEGGADIEKKSDKIIIKKSAPLRQKTPFRILTDRNELVTYATLSVASGGEVEIGPVSENIIGSFLEVMKKANVGVEKIKEDTFRFFNKGEILPVVIETSPHPGFMTDWQPNFAVMLLKANGVAQITERIFENRFSYVEELKKLGAKIEYSQTVTNDPEKYFYFNWEPGKIYNQTIKIHGGQTLHNGVLTIKDLRAGAALACAALLVDGESIVNGVSQLERGYEDFVGKIKDLGGEIRKI